MSLFYSGLKMEAADSSEGMFLENLLLGLHPQSLFIS
jgi:hypothetical protein